jgi:hypothetical protein
MIKNSRIKNFIFPVGSFKINNRFQLTIIIKMSQFLNMKRHFKSHIEGLLVVGRKRRLWCNMQVP